MQRVCIKVILLADGVNDKQPRSGLQRRILQWQQEVQAWTLAARARHNQPVCPRPLRYRKEDVHRPAAGRVAAAARHVLGKFIKSVNFNPDMNSTTFAWADIVLLIYSWSEILRSLRQITSRWMWFIRDSWFPTENFLLPLLRDEVRRRFSSSFQLPASTLLCWELR